MPRLIPATIGVLALALLPTAAQAQRGILPSVISIGAHDVNEVFLGVTNRGAFGLQRADIGMPGNFFPIATPNVYLFGSGIWIGGIGDVDANGVPDTITTIGYNPQDTNENEWIEGAVGQNPNDPRFRVLVGSLLFFDVSGFNRTAASAPPAPMAPVAGEPGTNGA